MAALEKRFVDEADQQIAAEDKAARDRRVKERAIRIMGEAQRVAAGQTRPGLAEMRAELEALDARQPWSLSAADDARRDWLRQEIFDLTKKVA
jgi:hypothetical protein